ncbi:hypothetical protein ADMFC3_09880 [Geovibrio sp. ADMFC3]
MNELPKGWVETELIEISEIVLGQSPPSETYNDDGDGLPFYQGKTEFGKKSPTPRKWCNQPNKIALENDILLSVRAPVGPTNLSLHKSCIGRGLAAVRPIIVDYMYVYYFFKQIEPELSGKGTGTTFNAITGDVVKSISIHLPPLTEQKRIVEKIEALFSRLDAGIAALEKTKAQLKRYKQSVLKAAFEGSLIKSDCVWQEINLSDCCIKITDGTHHSPVNKPNGDYKYITAKNIKEYSLDLDNITYISKKDHDEIYSRCDVKYRDVLYIKDGATTGRACINTLNEEYSLLSSVCVLRPDENKLLPEFLTFFLNSRIARDEMFKNIAGVAITRLTLKKIKTSKIQVPNVLIQRQIVTKIEKFFSVANKALETVEQELKKAQALKSKILEYAFTGKLVPQNPDDEPAEVLLERIKAEKEAFQSTKKTRKRQ